MDERGRREHALRFTLLLVLAPRSLSPSCRSSSGENMWRGKKMRDVRSSVERRRGMRRDLMDVAIVDRGMDGHDAARFWRREEGQRSVVVRRALRIRDGLVGPGKAMVDRGGWRGGGGGDKRVALVAEGG